MNIPAILLSCLFCTGLAITVHYETSLGKTGNENQNGLKDIRLVGANQENEPLPKPIMVDTKNDAQRTRQNTKSRNKYRGDKRKQPIERLGETNRNTPVDPSYQLYMQKVASQLLTAQKHAPVLSDYQKFILNQDQNVKKFVLGQSTQERNPKPFSKGRQPGRARSLAPKTEPIAAANGPLQKIVVVTPKVQSTVQVTPQVTPQHDHTVQATQVKYVTLAPQYSSFHDASQKVTFLPYHSQPQYTYYDLGVTAKPHVHQISSTLSSGLSSFEYYKDKEEDSVHHEDAKYEFMYKVKDHENHSDFGHKESRSDKTTYGYYYVHLPDGRLETVKYWADKTGYHAKVDYQGEAKHPVHSEHKLHSHNFLHH